jgi:hypothetical protein
MSLTMVSKYSLQYQGSISKLYILTHNKIKIKKYYTVGTIPKSNIKIADMGRDRMVYVIGFITTDAISAYHH